MRAQAARYYQEGRGTARYIGECGPRETASKYHPGCKASRGDMDARVTLRGHVLAVTRTLAARLRHRRLMLPRKCSGWRCRQSPADHQAIRSCSFRTRQRRISPRLMHSLEAGEAVTTAADRRLQCRREIAGRAKSQPDVMYWRSCCHMTRMARRRSSRARRPHRKRRQKFGVPWTPHWNHTCD